MTSFVPMEGSDYMLSVLFGRIEEPLETYWMALVNTLPDEGDSGDTITEPIGDPAYARIAVPNTDEVWALSGYGEVENLIDLIWPPVGFGQDWGELVAAVLLDTPEKFTGRLLMGGQLSPPIRPDPDVSVRIPAGGLSLSLSSISPSYEPT